MSPPKRQRVANPLFAAPFSYRRVLRLGAEIGEFPTGDLSMGPGFDLRVHSGMELPDLSRINSAVRECHHTLTMVDGRTKVIEARLPQPPTRSWLALAVAGVLLLGIGGGLALSNISQEAFKTTQTRSEPSTH